MVQAAVNTGSWGGLAQSTSNSYMQVDKPGMYEYLLVANPGPEINAQLMTEKERFYNTYKQKSAVKTLPTKPNQP